MYIIFSVLYFFINFSFSYQNIVCTNEWADNLIEDVKNNLKNTDSEYIQVPDLKQEDVKLVGKIPVKLKFLAIDGVLGELTSLKRVGGIKISRSSAETTITIPLSLSKVGLHFENCFIASGSRTAWDELEIKVTPDESVLLKVVLLVTSDPHGFVPQLKDVVIEKFKNADIILNEYCLSDINIKIFQWIMTYLNDSALGSLKLKLTEVFMKILGRYEKHKKSPM